MPRYDVRTQGRAETNHILILVDGKPVPAAVACDTDEGWIEYYELDEHGHLTSDKMVDEDTYGVKFKVREVKRKYTDFTVVDKRKNEVMYEVKTRS